MKYLKFFQYTLLSASIFIMGVPPSAAMDDDISRNPSHRHTVPSNEVDSKEESSEDENDSSTKFANKIEETDELLRVENGYYDARLITFGTHFFVRDTDHYQLHAQGSDEKAVRLYKQNPHLVEQVTNSQLLITEDELSLGVSVSTSIIETTKRPKGTASTFVQYDKTHVKQQNKDFLVDATNEKGDANYDGGHLTDYKFSAQGSHTNDFNYVPQHHAYNRWIKESIVKQRKSKKEDNIEGYVEIPLYTPQPPSIKVLGEDRYDPIPIGIILLSLKNKAILNAYYFPNNQYNYRELQSTLGLPRLSGTKVAPYFKLKTAFHQLLWPAIIYDGRKNNVLLAAQVDKEAQRVNMVDALVEGMSTFDVEGDEAILSRLASNVLYQENVDLANVLDLDEEQGELLNINQPNQNALRQSFNFLGQFLINYSMRNALKSEVLLPTSRIMFLNIMVDFFDNYWQFEDDALKSLDYIHETFLEDFKSSLAELEGQKEHMNLRDILYFANLYEKLSTESMHAAFHAGYGVGDDFEDIEDNFRKFIQILQIVSNKTKQETPTHEQMQNLVSVFSGAQNNLSYVITLCGGDSSEFSKQKQFLKGMHSQVSAWNKNSEALSGSYQVSPNSTMSFRGINGPNTSILGTNSSLIYPNADSDEETSDDDTKDLESLE